MTTEGIFVGPCFHCKSQMWLPQELYESAKRSERITFYCPYGHPQVFAKGESEADKFRRERDRALQQLAQKDDEIKGLERRNASTVASLNAAKAANTRSRKRAAAGLCPCCNRSFASTRIAAHMKTKHPEFKAEEVH